MAPREITRRDFLNGTRIAVAGAALSPWVELFGATAPAFAADDPFPPALTGLRGSHDGAWEAAHALVSGRRFEAGAAARRESVDLVVVGAGISGLAAAWFYRKARPGARILILENHDDFGGHAKRNEFEAAGRTLIGYGGTESIDGPASYSAVARELLRELGVDVEVFRRAFDASVYESLGLSVGVFFDRESFGIDRLVAGYGSLPWPEFAARTPLSTRARADLVRLQTESRDYLPGLSRDEKVALLEKTSYEDFLLRHARVDPELLRLYRGMSLEYLALGADSFPAYWISQEPFLPGLEGTLVERARPEEPYIFHFPDGNASIARRLVWSLVPTALPARSAEAVLLAKPRYGLLDVEGAPVRVRLSSTAVGAHNAADGAGVDVTYVRDGVVGTVRARDCVLACWNSVIPYLCPELPDRQKRGLAYGVKAPLVYVNVLLRGWRAFVDAGVQEIYAPNQTYSFARLDFPVSLDGYRAPRSPDEPILLHLVHVPHHPETPGAEQWRAGRRALLGTPFATYEAKLREQLRRMLGPGFDGDEQILAITVNRWPHGYAYQPNTLWDAAWASEAERPWVIGRQRFGRIAIANADAAANAYTDAAIDQAHRAVGELLAGTAGASEARSEP
jgi:spermidine dehydrogenase